MSSYKDLDIYKMSLSLFYEVHPMSLKLPKYEFGSQLRRSADSIVTNIVKVMVEVRVKQNLSGF